MEYKKDEDELIPVWARILVGLVIIGLIVFVASILTSAVTDGDNEIESQVVQEQMDISVTSQNVKLIDGKYRYFFDIKNNDDKSFVGDINIDLISAEGKSIYDKNFKDASIGVGIGKSIYIDISTGPVQVHGVNGISNFEFTASKGDQVIKSGSGSIVTQ